MSRSALRDCAADGQRPGLETPACMSRSAPSRSRCRWAEAGSGDTGLHEPVRALAIALPDGQRPGLETPAYMSRSALSRSRWMSACQSVARFHCGGRHRRTPATAAGLARRRMTDDRALYDLIERSQRRRLMVIHRAREWIGPVAAQAAGDDRWGGGRARCAGAAVTRRDPALERGPSAPGVPGLGRLVDVGGLRMHLACAGTVEPGEAIVVIDGDVAAFRSIGSRSRSG